VLGLGTWLITRMCWWVQFSSGSGRSLCARFVIHNSKSLLACSPGTSMPMTTNEVETYSSKKIAYASWGKFLYPQAVCVGPNRPDYVCVGLARTLYIRYFWQGNHPVYGHIRCIYTVMANPTYVRSFTCGNQACDPFVVFKRACNAQPKKEHGMR
jgi:hypothetical protein